MAKTVIISPATPSAPAAPKPAPAQSPEAASDIPFTGNDKQVATLFVLNGKISGRRIELTKAVTNLGKTGRPAGVITRTAEGYILRAADENDKPKVNGRPLAEGGMKLRNGDIVEVAGTRLQFYLK